MLRSTSGDFNQLRATLRRMLQPRCHDIGNSGHIDDVVCRQRRRVRLCSLPSPTQHSFENSSQAPAILTATSHPVIQAASPEGWCNSAKEEIFRLPNESRGQFSFSLTYSLTERKGLTPRRVRCLLLLAAHAREQCHFSRQCTRGIRRDVRTLLKAAWVKAEGGRTIQDGEETRLKGVHKN